MSTRWGLGSDLSVATHKGGKDGGASRCAHARHHLSDLASMAEFKYGISWS